jgi:hypothetical protein
LDPLFHSDDSQTLFLRRFEAFAVVLDGGANHVRFLLQIDPDHPCAGVSGGVPHRLLGHAEYAGPMLIG